MGIMSICYSANQRDHWKSNPQNSARAGQPILVVIIDSFAVFRSTLRKMIRDRIPQANIVEIDDFERVREVLNIQSPDVIFIDPAIFPSKSIERLRSIKHQQPNSVIVVLTTHDSVEHKAAALKHGANYFFSKTDSSIKSLINTVDKTLS
jgi:DNA-binding NarL/FixJ family response regulator